VGHYDNTDMAKIVADRLDLNLEKVQNRLYVDVSAVFKPNEYSLNMADPANPVLQISFNGKTATLPVSKDTMIVTSNNGYSRTYALEGLTVRTPMISQNQVFIPQQAVQLLK
jgi:hypothetical protein